MQATALHDKLRDFSPVPYHPQEEINGIRVIPMLAGNFALAALTPDRIYPLCSGTLQEMLQEAESLAAEFCLPVDASCLAGPHLSVRYAKDRRVLGVWVPFARGTFQFESAETAYQHLAQRGYEVNRGNVMKCDDGTRYRVLFLAESNVIEAESAWDVVKHRLQHGGQAPRNEQFGIPYDTCPRCLHRHVIIHDHRRTCQECLYADPEL